jgi:ribosomal protein S28E/S33
MSKEKKSDKISVGAFDATLSAIKAASETLNRAADDASVEIDALEQELAAIEPGVSVWTGVLFQEPTTFVGSNGTQNGVRAVKLGFLKGKKGGLVVSDAVIAMDGSVVQHDELPLRKAERETRLLLRAHLSDVLNLVLTTLTVQVGRLPVVATPEPDALSA